MQVLDEIGVDIAAAAPRAHAKKVPQKQAEEQEAAEVENDMDALTARLANLKS